MPITRLVIGRLCEEEQKFIRSCLCQLWNPIVVTSRFGLMDLQWLPPTSYTKSRFIGSNQSTLSTLPIICTLFPFSFHLTLQHNCTMGNSISISVSTVSFCICSFYLESLCFSHGIRCKTLCILLPRSLPPDRHSIGPSIVSFSVTVYQVCM